RRLRARPKTGAKGRSFQPDRNPSRPRSDQHSQHPHTTARTRPRSGVRKPETGNWGQTPVSKKPGSDPTFTSEKSQCFGAVADQEAFGLLVVGEGHFVGFAADAGFFVASECGVGGVHVVAVRPDTAGFHAPADAVGT